MFEPRAGKEVGVTLVVDEETAKDLLTLLRTERWPRMVEAAARLDAVFCVLNGTVTE
jgi:hypothetical protein